jgi:hypothetical protein
MTAIISMAVSSMPVFANSDWVTAVLKHPSLRVQDSAIEEQHWKILELEAEKGFDFDIKSSTHLPLTEHFDDSFKRAAQYDPYLDLVFTASHTVYDFGEADALVNAQRALQTKARLAFANGFEQQAHSLFSLVIQHLKAQKTIAILHTVQAEIGLIQADLVRRYEAGLGTLAGIRRTQLSQIDLETQFTQLSNKVDAVEQILISDYDLEIAALVDTWNAIEPQLKPATHIDQQALRSSAISQDAQTSLRHQRASIAAQKKPKIMVDINTTLYDVTRSLSNYRVAGEFRLTLPAFDSGYRSAKMASISHAITAEQQALEHVIQQKTLDLQSSKRQFDDLDLRQQKSIEKVNNLSLQLSNKKLALGNTDNDHAGLANLATQHASAKIDLIGITYDMQQLLLDRVLLSEQIIQQFNVTSEQLP